MPHGDRADDPDFVEMYRYADLDALVELHGHLRSVNPDSRVNIRAPSDLVRDDYTDHLVVLGGVDWNTLTQDVLYRLDLPVRQSVRETDASMGCFEVGDGDQLRQFSPVVRTGSRGPILMEDVAHFYRGPNPFNRKRTVTICNAMYGRGVFGVVRALTDAKFRDRNAEYIAGRLAGRDQFSILSQISVVNGTVVTPDWTVSTNRLHEWPEAE
jgi:hypothetical protein